MGTLRGFAQGKENALIAFCLVASPIFAPVYVCLALRLTQHSFNIFLHQKAEIPALKSGALVFCIKD